MLATEYAKWHNIEPQKENESDFAFKDRVSGALRNAGNIIEAHEVAQDKRYDAEGGEMVMHGITGAIAMATSGISYGSKGSSLVGDEIAAGVVASEPKNDNDALMALLSVLLFDKR